MVLAGSLMILFTLYGVYLSMRDKLENRPFYLKTLVWMIPLPFIANSAGWLMTEVGRQPWVVFGLLKTANGVSPTVPAGMVLTSYVGLTLVYALLLVLDIYLFSKAISQGPDEEEPGTRASKTVVPSL